MLQPSDQLHVLDFDGDGDSEILEVSAQVLPAPAATVLLIGRSGTNLTGTTTAQLRMALPVLSPGDTTTLRTEVLGGAAANFSAVQPGYDADNVKSLVVGDVDGDGRQDALIALTQIARIQSNDGVFTFPDIGRVYLVRGTGLGSIVNTTLAAQATAFFEDFTLGASIAALGDIDADGLDDFAIGRSIEDFVTTAVPGLSAFFDAAPSVAAFRSATGPGAGIGPAGGRISGLVDPGDSRHIARHTDLGIRRDRSDALPTGVLYAGALQVHAGDLDGDGRADLVVGEPVRALGIFTASLDATLDRDDPAFELPVRLVQSDPRGRVHVFHDIAATPFQGGLAFADADVTIVGASGSERFGTLPVTPGIDVDQDGIDDLFIGAPFASTVGATVLERAGRVSFVPGTPSRVALPDDDLVVDVVNRTVSGSGDFLVDRATGNPIVFRRTAEDDLRFTLAAGELEKWYRFTTLGDGLPGHRVRIGAEGMAGFTARDFQATSVALSNPGGFFAAPGPDTILVVGGPQQQQLFYTFDLSMLLPYIDHPELLTATLRPGTLGGGLTTAGLRFELLAERPDLRDPAASDVTATGITLSLADGGLTQALREALAAGLTRLTVRVTSTVGAGLPSIQNPTLAIAAAAIPGLVADFHDEQGGLLRSDGSVIDLRRFEAGTYYLRVHRAFDPRATQAREVVLDFKVPLPGATHDLSDRDEIRGGESNDVLVGNDDLDRVYGENGDDYAVAEPVELRDRSATEAAGGNLFFKIAAESERITQQPRPRDVEIRFDLSVPVEERGFADRDLQELVARQLGIPILTRFDGTRAPARPMFTSELATLTMLGAGPQGLARVTGITDLQGIEYLTGLRVLNLSGQGVSSLERIRPASDRRLLPGAEIGLPDLELFSGDYMGVVLTDELAELRHLRYLSLDASDPIVGGALSNLEPLRELAELRWLSLANQSVRDTSVVEGLPGLAYVDLFGNAVRSVNGFLGWRIVDDLENGYAEGPGFTGSSNPLGYDRDYRLHPAQGDGRVAYVFANLAAGSYHVLAAWPEHETRSTSVRYSVSGESAIVSGFDFFAPAAPETPANLGQAFNPFLAGGAERTPVMEGLSFGNAAFGLTNLNAAAILSAEVRNRAPAGAKAAVLRVAAGPAGLADRYPGFDLLLFVNLTVEAVEAPMLGIGGPMTALVGNPAAPQGSGGVFTTLAPNGVYATLVPVDMDQIAASVGTGAARRVGTASLDAGELVYLSETPHEALVNQVLAPSSTAGRFQNLGVFDSTSGTLRVEVDRLGSRNFAADVIRLVSTDSGTGLRVLDLRANPLDDDAHTLALPPLQLLVPDQAGTTFVREGVLADPNPNPPTLQPIAPQSAAAAGTSVELFASDPDAGSAFSFVASSSSPDLTTSIASLGGGGGSLRSFVNLEPNTDQGFANVTVTARDGTGQRGQALGGRTHSQTFVVTWSNGTVDGISSVHGVFFDDVNGDGVRQTPPEGVLEGFTIYDDRDGDGTLDPGETFGVSDALGQWALPGLDALARPRLAVLPREGWVVTALPAVQSSVRDRFLPVGDFTKVSGSVELGAALFFGGSTDTDGLEPFVLDAFGFRKLADLNTTAANGGGSDPFSFVVFENSVFFLASDGTRTQVYRTDGNTVQIVDPNHSFEIYGAGDLSELFVLGGELYVTGDTQQAPGGNGGDLAFFRLDGSTFTVASQGDLTKGNVVLNGAAFGVSAITGRLARFDGSTFQVVGTRTVTSNLAVFQNAVYYGAVGSGTIGTELFRFTGSVEQLAADLRSAFFGTSRSSSPHDLVVFDGQLYFAVSPDFLFNDPAGIFRFNGTTASAFFTSNVFASFSELTVAGGKLWAVEQPSSGTATQIERYGAATGREVIVGVDPTRRPELEVWDDILLALRPDEIEAFLLPAVVTTSQPGVPIAIGGVAAVDAGPDLTGVEGTLVRVNAAQVFDRNLADGSRFDFVWRVTRGSTVVVQSSGTVPTTPVTGAPPGTFAVPERTFTPTDDGIYVATLTITDQDDGNRQYVTEAQIFVANAAPGVSLALRAGAALQEGTTIQLNPVGAPLFTDAGSADTHTVSWSVAKVVSGAPIDLPLSNADRTNPNFRFVPPENGLYRLTLTVTDDEGASSSATVDANIANVAPLLTLPVPAAVKEGDLVSFTNAVRDPGAADAFTTEWTATQLNAAGTPDDVVVATGTTPDFAFTPEQDGSYTVRLVARDDDDGSRNATVTFAVANVAPTLTVPAELTVAQGTAVDLLASFSDPGLRDAFTTSVMIEGPKPATGSGNGSLVLTESGLGASFSPLAPGAYTATFSVGDGLATTTGTTRITVENARPLVQIQVNTGGSDVREGTPIELEAIATDPGNDALGYTWRAFRFGSPTLLGSGNQKAFSFAPPDDGAYAIALDVSDGLTTNGDVFFLNAGNALPAVQLGADRAVDEGTALPVLRATKGTSFTDAGSADSHAFRWTVVSDNGVVIAPVTGATLSLGARPSGHYLATLEVTDDDGGKGSDSVLLTVGNAAPVVALTGTPPAQVIEKELFTLTGRVTDAAGDRIEALADYGDGTLVPLVLGPGGAFTLSHAYASATAGQATRGVTVLARDSEGASSPSTALFSLRVLPAGLDTDGDGVPDSRDNAILVPNPAQTDTDGDGYGNAADPDFDNNGIVNFADLSRLKSALFKADPLVDLTGDGIVNFADLSRLKNLFFKEPGPSALHPPAPGPAPVPVPQAAAAPGTATRSGIDPSAFVDPTAVVGFGSVVGAEARIDARARLGVGVEVAPETRIGADAAVGDQAAIGQGAVVGRHARIGQRVRLGRHVVVEPGAIVPDDTVVLDGSVVKRARRRLRVS